jgi:FAD/FMN-containing dehydrogenase
LSSLHGVGADQILSLRVVTADGQFRAASPTENTDLFWAIRGGGGSTFGVVTSMVVKAFPDQRTAIATFEWGVKTSNISTAAF